MLSLRILTERGLEVIPQVGDRIQLRIASPNHIEIFLFRGLDILWIDQVGRICGIRVSPKTPNKVMQTWRFFSQLLSYDYRDIKIKIVERGKGIIIAEITEIGKNPHSLGYVSSELH